MITGKPWVEFHLKDVENIPDAHGIYEFGDAHRDTIYIGAADREGLRTYLLRHRTERPDPCIASSAYYFRYEETEQAVAWCDRILEAFRASHNGRVPPCNCAETDKG